MYFESFTGVLHKWVFGCMDVCASYECLVPIVVRREDGDLLEEEL